MVGNEDIRPFIVGLYEAAVPLGRVSIIPPSAWPWETCLDEGDDIGPVRYPVRKPEFGSLKDTPFRASLVGVLRSGHGSIDTRTSRMLAYTPGRKQGDVSGTHAKVGPRRKDAEGFR